MSETVDVFLDKLVGVIQSLASKSKPKTVAGEMHIKHLISYIESNNTVSLSVIIRHLSCAGYDAETILKVLYDAGIIGKSDDWVRFRDAVRRVMLEGGCE